MPRPPVTVRDAVPDDLPDLLSLWREVRGLPGGLRAALPPPTDAAVLALLARARVDPGVRVRVAVVGTAVAGVAVLRREPAGLLDEGWGLDIACLQVREGCRRQGVGHALLAGAADLAEELGATHVVSSVPSQLRAAQRFYAKLGFGPSVVRRVVSVPALRRGLGSPAERPVGAVEGVLARRRSLRGRRTAGPATTD